MVSRCGVFFVLVVEILNSMSPLWPMYAVRFALAPIWMVCLVDLTLMMALYEPVDALR